MATPRGIFTASKNRVQEGHDRPLGRPFHGGKKILNSIGHAGQTVDEILAGTKRDNYTMSRTVKRAAPCLVKGMTGLSAFYQL